MNDTIRIVQVRSSHENRESREREKFRRMNTPIQGLDSIRLSNTNFHTPVAN
jgi:hypothetical protein